MTTFQDIYSLGKYNLGTLMFQPRPVPARASENEQLQIPSQYKSGCRVLDAMCGFRFRQVSALRWG